MVDSDNKLSKANKLNVSGNRVDSLGSTDLEDLHRFTLDKRSQVTLSLSKIGKGAKVRTELYALTGSLNKRLKKTDFNKLGAKDLQGILRRVSVSELGDLAAGEYYARVLGGKGKSRYQLKLSAAPIVDPSIVTPPVVIGVTPPVETPVTPPIGTPITPPIGTPITPPIGTPITPPIGTPITPPVGTPITPPVETPVTPPIGTPITPPVGIPITPPVGTPITPPIKPPAKSVKARISRTPNGDTHIAELDFSKSQDENPAEDKGLFKGAVINGRVESLDGGPNGGPGLTRYRTGDLISFINADGQTEYQAKLLNPTGKNQGSQSSSSSEDDEDYHALFVKFILPASHEADPDSLSFLQKVFNQIALDDNGKFKDANEEELQEGIYFGYGTGSKDATFDNGKLPRLRSLYPSNGEGNDYIEMGNHYSRDHYDELPGGSGGGNDTIYAGNGNDNFDGGEGEDLLYGRAGNDILHGGNDNDILYGGDGTDSLFGGDGDDTLNGFLSRNDAGTRSGEQFDYLTGGNGNDYFVLADPNKVFYHGAGDGYAVIEDWDNQSDFIQVKGNASQYRLEFKDVVGSTALDTEIYYASGTINDRIALVTDTIDVDFSRFRFV